MAPRSRVAVVGIGQVGYRSAITELEYKEMDYEAAAKACADAEIDPRKDIGSFVHAQEDFWEGYSITSEYSPDQVGGALRSVCTVTGDGLQAFVTAFMHIVSGVSEVALVVSHGKPSEILDMNKVMQLALDPVYERPLGINHLTPYAFEARAFLDKYRLGREALAYVVAKNRRNALRNPRAAYPIDMNKEDILMHGEEIPPLSRLDVAGYADGAVVVILADARRARKMSEVPVYVRGVAWASETSSLSMRDYYGFPHVRYAAKKSIEMAGVRRPGREIDLAELEDRVSYMELQSVVAYGFFQDRELKQVVNRGLTEMGGDVPVNVSGGALGMGNILEATGLARLYEAVLQLRGEAGQNQLDEAEVAVVNSRREPPSGTCTSVILSTEP
ncbi:MAG TPA: hypothetical protein EYH45_06925 [Candidatus Caldiarchaeum subterraneum]|uniref:Thiolase C-terminal domain-containing protein n=1 Tax=Caldiarchaeum subterraneum TaxID=311458 RepID=A0A832ZWQ3_CALS0|nr:hypothetical protein [Aigarchaeota archaeon]HIQ30280.1 hypothetical protein [Candidatus Caldarchaeum subterraneum]